LADCFAGQPKNRTLQYRIDPGRTVDAGGQSVAALERAGFKNAEIAFPPAQVLTKIQARWQHFAPQASRDAESGEKLAVFQLRLAGTGWTCSTPS